MTESVSPEVTVCGPDGDPEVTVVGGIHGDEPSGVRAIERVLDAAPTFRRTVQFVRANPPALDANRRSLDTDLNRAFPGDPDAEDRERRLAADLCALVADTPTLSLHSTHSQPEPMALVSRDRPRAQELAAGLPTPSVVDVDDVVEGSLTTCGPVVTVEAGCQHSEAATETATEMVFAFLRLLDAIPGTPPESDPTFYGMDEAVEKPNWAPDSLSCSRVFDLHVENFEPVSAGTVWATVDGEELVADDEFVPILLSECGYQDIFGYKGYVAGETLTTARDRWERRPHPGQ